jgi:vacuolar protein sorting-associated protein 35
MWNSLMWPSPELHTPATTANFLSLLLAPITSYVSVLTLLAIPNYIPLLSIQPFTTRASIGQAVVASVLKNGTVMETAEDVAGVLGLCAVLVKDQKETSGQQSGQMGRGQRMGTQTQIALAGQDLAEEQGWLARMVHLFRSDDLATQFEVSTVGTR